jgi:galactokinase/galacturonokinase
MALIDPVKADTILHRVGEKYLKEYPALEGKYMSALCSSADGVSL